MGVGDAYTSDRRAFSGCWRWSIGGATNVEEQVVQESNEGGDGVVKEGVEQRGRGEDGRWWAEEGHCCEQLDEVAVDLDVNARRQRWDGRVGREKMAVGQLQDVWAIDCSVRAALVAA